MNLTTTRVNALLSIAGLALTLGATSCSVSTSGDGSSGGGGSSFASDGGSTPATHGDASAPVGGDFPSVPVGGPTGQVPGTDTPTDQPGGSSLSPDPVITDGTSGGSGSGGSGSGGSGTGGSGSKVTATVAKRNLAHMVGSGQSSAVVPVADGYQAVVFDNVGNLVFFASKDGVTWTVSQRSKYRYDPRDARGQHVTATGTRLSRMSDATFILHGTFSGDGSGNAMAYTNGRFGWGPIIPSGTPAKPDQTRLAVPGSLPGEYSGYQVSYLNLDFNHGYLRAHDCYVSTKVPQSDCGKPGTLITSYWLWDQQEKDFRSAQ